MYDANMFLSKKLKLRNQEKIDEIIGELKKVSDDFKSRGFDDIYLSSDKPINLNIEAEGKSTEKEILMNIRKQRVDKLNKIKREKDLLEKELNSIDERINNE